MGRAGVWKQRDNRISESQPHNLISDFARVQQGSNDDGLVRAGDFCWPYNGRTCQPLAAQDWIIVDQCANSSVCKAGKGQQFHRELPRTPENHLIEMGEFCFQMRGDVFDQIFRMADIGGDLRRQLWIANN